VTAITAVRAETAALSARLREAEAVRADAEAQVAALHDQAAARAADTDRRATSPGSAHLHRTHKHTQHTRCARCGA